MHRNIRREGDHLLEQQRGAFQLDQIKRTAQLLQTLNGPLQQAAIVALFKKLLQQILNLAHADKKFIPDQIK
ncbi:hypothetical protein GCM10009083_11060 [Halopseudomonas pertucinogena]|uniref:Chorismate mutase n=1 Tax=Halopseudomonas pertucinogena TaxID=86175 RepID=A0ABQ2CP60_9GAMM|nr:hypothetical protein GCM10009083_11060 [Halopseudomonas pertucinogena]